jgi:hypothetical protein
MNREYDVFEVIGSGPVWHSRASGLVEARARLQQLRRQTGNECFAMHLPTHEIVARVNVRAPAGAKPVIVQIAYDSVLAVARTKVFRLQGYEVQTLLGSEAAKVVLGMGQRCDLFLVAHAAPLAIRTEMVKWLKANYAGVPIIALSADASSVDGADFNAKLNGPETLLPVIANALHGPGGTSAGSQQA